MDDDRLPVRFKRYGPVGHNEPIPRHGKTERDKASGAYQNRLANLTMRAEENRGGVRKKGKR